MLPHGIYVFETILLFIEQQFLYAMPQGSICATVCSLQARI